MHHKVLFDVNICLDVLLDRKPHVDNSGQLFEAVEKGKFEGFISAISFDTLYYILRPAIGGVKAVEQLKLLLLHMQVAGIEATTVNQALNSGWKDLEDALHYYSALHSGCDCVITRNSIDFKATMIPVYTPQDFISQFF